MARGKRLRVAAWLAAMAAGIGAATLIAPASFVRDLNTRTPTQGYPDVLCKSGTIVYFKIDDQVHGFELWRTDGTTAGTLLLKDAAAGMEHSGFDYECFGTSPDGITYLRISTPFTGWELWRTNGTPEGTLRIVEMNPGPEAGPGYFLGFAGNKAVFWGDDGTTGQELWVSDGTQEGTKLLKEFSPGDDAFSRHASSNFSYGVLSGDKVYFGAQALGGNMEVWLTDGTSSGTRRVAALLPGPGGYNFVRLGAYVLFRVSNPNEWGDDLWRTDGTPAGTVQLTATPPIGTMSVLERDPVSLGSTAVFSIRVNNSVVTLWSTDGTPAHTQPITGPNGDLIPVNLWSWRTLGNRLLFIGDTAATGQELWSTDGTEVGTRLLADIMPGAGDSTPEGFLGPQDAPYEVFLARSDTHGKEPWITDGTPAGTRLLKDLYPGDAGPVPGVGFASHNGIGYLLNQYAPSYGYAANSWQLWRYDFAANQFGLLREFRSDGSSILESIGNKVLFVTNETGQGLEMWVSDGSLTGTHLLRDIVRSGTTLDSDPYFLGVVGNVALMSAMNQNSLGSTTPTYALWSTDGTRDGTGQIYEVQPVGAAVPLPGNRLFFAGYYHAYGIEPWISSGTDTHVVKDINTGQPYSMREGCRGNRLVAMNGVAYFPAFDSSGGEELWRSDGASAGTQRVVDIAVGAGDSLPCEFAVAGGYLYFAATQNGDRELWCSDGTSAGTQRVADIRAGASSNPTGLAALGNAVYFAASGTSGRRELWRSDGTASGTVRVVDVSADASRTESIGGLKAVGNRLYFTACSDGGAPGCHLWSTDGTAGGTVSLAISDAGLLYGTRALGEFRGKLLFAGSDGASGKELWISDGTPAGTSLLENLNVNGDSDPIDFIDFNGIVYFRASTGNGVTQLWRTDGTTAGTVLASDLSTGETPSLAAANRWNAAVLGQTLLFPADDGVVGLEPWTLANSQPTAAVDSATATSGVAVSINVIANDTDLDGVIDPTSVRIVNQPSSGTASVNSTTGTISYTSNNGFTGSDQFSYAVSDSQRRESPSATVSITVNAAPATPGTGSNSGGNTDGESGGGGGLFGMYEALVLLLLMALRISRKAFVVAMAVGSTALLQGCGGGGDSQPPTPPPPANAAPSFTATSFTGTEETDLSVQVTASDPENNSLTFTKTSDPAHGSIVSFNTNGSFVYRPAWNFAGSDSFGVRVTDSANNAVTGTVQLTISNVNDAPVAANDVVEVNTAGANAVNILDNDIDADGETLTVAIVEQPFVGIASVNSNGSVHLDLPAGFHGMTRFKYAVTDSANQTSNATAAVFVNMRGYRYVFAGIPDLGMLDIYMSDFTAPRQITHTQPGDQSIVSFFSSYGGETVLYSRFEPFMPGAVPKAYFIKTALGSEPVEIVPPTGRKLRFTLGLGGTPAGALSDITVSVDGRWVAFITDPDTLGGAPQPDIYLLDTQNPSVAQPIGTAAQGFSAYLQFALSSSNLYFISSGQAVSAASSIYRVNVSNPATPVRVSAAAASGNESINMYIVPADESAIYYLAKRDALSARMAAYRVATGTLGSETLLSTNLATDESVGQLVLSPDASMLVFTSTRTSSPNELRINRILTAPGSSPQFINGLSTVGYIFSYLGAIRPDNGAVLMSRFADQVNRDVAEVSMDTAVAPIVSPITSISSLYDYSGNRFIGTYISGFPSIFERSGNSFSASFLLGTNVEFQNLSYPDSATLHFLDSTVAWRRPTLANLDAPNDRYIVGDVEVPADFYLRYGAVILPLLTQ